MKKTSTMFAGMFLITGTILFIETGSLPVALKLGLITSSLKSCYALGHKRYWEGK